MTPQSTTTKLKQLSSFYQTQIELLMNGAKVKRKQDPQNIKLLKHDLRHIIQGIADNGDLSKYDWSLTRVVIIFILRDVLEAYNDKFKDSTSFVEELEIVLQYLVQFDRPPFTIQRLCELIIQPEKYYKSTKKLLYAFEKLVNVSEPTFE